MNRIFLFAPGVLFALTACSLALSVDRTQCATDGDCARNGADLVCREGLCTSTAALSTDASDGANDAAQRGDGGPWGCVGHGGIPSTATTPAKLKIIAIDGVSTLVPEFEPYQARPGVSVRLCAKRDPACANPLTPTVPVDANGVAEVPTPSVLEFYVEATGGGIAPVAWFPAVTGDASARLSKPMFIGTLLQADLSTLAAVLGTSPEADRGIVLTRTVSCSATTSEAAAGIALTAEPIDAKTVPFYTIDGLPSATASATDKAGLAGFVNVPLGRVTVTAKFASSGTTLGAASTLTRAGWLSIVEIPPRAD
jgi:hypothetical protein